MLDGVSLDQIRIFVAAADEGSFSAAGRKLNRAQSVVSQTIANLEGQIGVTLSMFGLGMLLFEWVWGVLADRFGYRGPLLVSLLL